MKAQKNDNKNFPQCISLNTLAEKGYEFSYNLYEKNDVDDELNAEIFEKIKSVAINKEQLINEIKVFALDNVGLCPKEHEIIKYKQDGHTINEIAKKIKTNRWQVNRIYNQGQMKIKKFVAHVAPQIPSLAFFNHAAIDYVLGSIRIHDAKKVGKKRLAIIPRESPLDIKYFLNSIKKTLYTLKPGIEIPLIDYWRYRCGGHTRYINKIKKIRNNNKRITKLKDNEFISKKSIEEIIDCYRQPCEKQYSEDYDVWFEKYHVPVAKKMKNKLIK